MIEEITVRNLRSFHEPTTFKIAPITIFLGQNSAGKSSITRLFPLLKQSTEQSSSSPILWNSTYVDYGSIQEVITRNVSDPTLGISLSLTPVVYPPPIHINRRNEQEGTRLSQLVFTTELGIGTRGRTKTNRSVLDIDSDKLEFFYDQKGRINRLQINGESAADIVPKIKIEGTQRSLVPLIQLGDLPQSYFGSEAVSFGRRIGDILGPELGFAPTAKLFVSLARTLSYRPKSNFTQNLAAAISAADPDMRVETDRLNPSSLEQLRVLTLLRDLPRITRQVMEQIFSDIGSSQYIGPIRARAERYYRTQELAIDHIDPTGENMAMYLSFLPPKLLRQFNSIFESSFGYIVEPIQSKGHVSLILREPGKGSGDNIADVGFGFSQVLPVVAQLFAATAEPDVRDRLAYRFGREFPIVAVEQPELHLHPAFQAKLADLFSGLVKSNSRDLRKRRFVIETHSEAIVNRFGSLIARGELKPEDIIIYTFEKCSESNHSIVKSLSFTKDGIIENWPVGFLSA